MGDSGGSSLPLAVITAPRPGALRGPASASTPHHQHRFPRQQSVSIGDATARRTRRNGQRGIHAPSEQPQQPQQQAAGAAAVQQRRSGRRALRCLAMAVPGLLGRALTRANNKAVGKALALGAAALLTLKSIPALVPWLPGSGHRAPPPAAAAGRAATLAWFRSDLRLHDNEALTRANQAAATGLLPVYVFDPREFGAAPAARPAGGASAAGLSERVGPHRALFLVESVAELRRGLRALGSDLIVRVGRPEQVLPALAREAGGAAAVHCHGEPSFGDARVEAAVRDALRRGADGCQLTVHWGGTLHHVSDLPFRVAAMPASYGDFRARVANLHVRPALPRPESLKGLPPGGGIDAGEVPSLEQLGFTAAEVEAVRRQQQQQQQALLGGLGRGLPAAAAGPGQGLQQMVLRGGEAQALSHLRTFLAGLQRAAAAGGDAGNGSGGGGGGAFSCAVSPWLSAGCLSPRLVYQEAVKYMPGGRGGQGAAAAAVGQKGAGGGSGGSGGAAGSWLVLELMWRDFFRLLTHKYTQQGVKGQVAGNPRQGARQQHQGSRELAMA